MNLVEQIVDDHNLCGEGPLWDWRQNRLIWNDLSASLVFEYCPESGSRTIINRGLMAAGMALNDDGGLVLAGSTGIHVWRGQSQCRTVISEYQNRLLQCNDILADSRGRLYVGTMYWHESTMVRPGELYLIDNDGSPQIVDEGISLANGLGLSPDGGTLYFADSAQHSIYAYDVDIANGTLSHKRVFVEVPKSEGLPDGLVVDADGFVWCALWYGGQVVRYDPDGRIERCITLPASQVTSLEFGGPALTDLYVTSAAEPWPNNLLPHYDSRSGNLGGALYRIQLDIAGNRRHLARIG